MKILFLQQIAILKAKHSRRPQSFLWNMTKLPSNDEITLFDGTVLIFVDFKRWMTDESQLCGGKYTGASFPNKIIPGIFLY
jgi:hypothetical protein